MEAANAVLERWADHAPDSGYDQCDFQIVFEDGFRYRGHYPLRKSQKRISLARHVRKQLTALAAQNCAKKRIKPDETPDITPIGDSVADSARMALDHYNI